MWEVRADLAEKMTGEQWPSRGKGGAVWSLGKSRVGRGQSGGKEGQCEEAGWAGVRREAWGGAGRGHRTSEESSQGGLWEGWGTCFDHIPCKNA